MFDLLSLFQGRGDKTLTGSYYDKTPLTPANASEAFDYEYIDGNSYEYKMIIGNLRADSNVAVISTKDACKWKRNSHVVLQDGNLYVIKSIRPDLKNISKLSYRLHNVAYDVDYIVSLIEVDNPYGLK